VRLSADPEPGPDLERLGQVDGLDAAALVQEVAAPAGDAAVSGTRQLPTPVSGLADAQCADRRRGAILVVMVTPLPVPQVAQA